MGIIVKDESTQHIVFYLKGADSVMTSIVQYNDWLDEEVICQFLLVKKCVFDFGNILKCENMAREGLRTLVVAKKDITSEVYNEFEVSASVQFGYRIMTCVCPSNY